MRRAACQKKVLSLSVLITVLSGIFLCGCADNNEQITSFSQLREPGRVIAVSTDTPETALVMKEFDKATIESCTDIFPAYQEVANGKTDACIYARLQMELAIENGVSGVCLLDENYCENISAVAFSRKSSIPDIRNRFNEFLQSLKNDGTFDDMYRRWIQGEDPVMPDIPEIKSPERILKVATTGTVQPYSYYVGDKLTGFDIEMAKRFAAWLNAGVEFRIYDFNGIMAATQAGEADCIMSNLYYTPEREEAMDWSDPVNTVEIAAMVRDQNAAKGSINNSFSSLKTSFVKTFIRENRWKLFLSGIGTTLLITIWSILLGTLLGFVAFMACRHGNRIPNTITHFCVWLVNGLPVVVLLMILYYVIFGRIKIPGMLVAIIGFAFIFGAWVFEMLKAGTATVGIGQTEAAFSMGYTDRQTFYKIVLPQAMPHILPVFKGDVTALIKATAVVGYIAVQDITKMADIVRSRTYEAFFPLIAVAVIYFILAGLLTAVVDRIEPKFDPRSRSHEEILKGVELK